MQLADLEELSFVKGKLCDALRTISRQEDAIADLKLQMDELRAELSDRLDRVAERERKRDITLQKNPQLPAEAVSAGACTQLDDSMTLTAPPASMAVASGLPPAALSRRPCAPVLGAAASPGLAGGALPTGVVPGARTQLDDSMTFEDAQRMVWMMQQLTAEAVSALHGAGRASCQQQGQPETCGELEDSFSKIFERSGLAAGRRTSAHLAHLKSDHLEKPSSLDALRGAGFAKGLGVSPWIGGICLGNARGVQEAWGGARGRGLEIA